MSNNQETQPEKYISYIPRMDLKQYDMKRVAVYARVSREGELKHQSIEAQVSNLEDDVNNHPGWLFVGAYIDEGVTGTKMNRPAFNEMMEAARNGEIDIILTKSVSRFGRNMEAVLKTLHELNELDVTVIFDSEGISTTTPDANFHLQFKGIQAELESKKNSENKKWGIQKQFEEGIPTYTRLYGYRMINNQFYIVPEEAEIVKQIFTLFLSGMGRQAIAKRLNSEGIPSFTGGKWSNTTIGNILTNEKYAGDLLLQKYYREDCLTKLNKRNHGEYQQYFIADNHEAIIPKDIFNQVQAEIARRKEVSERIIGNAQSTGTGNPIKNQPRLFSRLITCASCGSPYQYKYMCGKTHRGDIWICCDYLKLGKAYCQNKAIPENILIKVTADVLLEQKLLKGKLAQGIISGDIPLTNELLRQYIHTIIAHPDQTLEYHLRNGEVVTKPWQFISRKYSWTPEMRKKAGEKTRARYEKLRQEKAKAEAKNKHEKGAKP